MNHDIQAYETHEPAIRVLKWVAGIVSASAAVLIAAGIIGGIVLYKTVSSNAYAIDRITRTQDAMQAGKADDTDVNRQIRNIYDRFGEKQRSIDANSARIVVLSKRVDALYRNSNAIWYPPLDWPRYRNRLLQYGLARVP